jgi:hypothetical protein
MCAAQDPLRIALLAYRGKPHVGGQGVYIRQLAKALVDLGHSVEVLGGQHDEHRPGDHMQSTAGGIAPCGAGAVAFGAMQVAAVIAVVLLGVVCLFQIALALGAPLGKAAWGGEH